MMLDFSLYDMIVVWGAGLSFKQGFKKTFHCDYLVDNNENKVGALIFGIEVISSNKFFLLCKDKKVLIVVSGSGFYDDIVRQAQNEGFIGDIVPMDEIDMTCNQYNMSFAQFGIDRFCYDILRKAKMNINDMSFVEIGANHPIMGNQTYLFYLFGARGLLVEPNPDLVDTLRKYRPKDAIANCGVGLQDGNLKFYRLNNSYRNSFDKKTVDMNIKLGFKVQDVIDIPVTTFDALLKNYNVNPSNTYLSLEVMGMEKEFFEQVDIFHMTFPLIRVADHYGLFDEFNDETLYVKIASLPRNVIFMRRDIYDAMVL